MIDAQYLLTDVDVARFLVNGYYIVEPDLPPASTSGLPASSTRYRPTPETPSPNPCPSFGKCWSIRRSGARWSACWARTIR